MKTVYKILNYEGPIHTLRRWTQELLGYSLTCVYRPNAMMQDVDAFSKYRNTLVIEHIVLTNLFQMQDI